MNPARKRAEAMARACDLQETTSDGWKVQVKAMVEFANVLDAYFAHTRFLDEPVGPGNFVRLKPEPIDE